MKDGLREFPKAFPEERIEVVRVIPGIRGSTLRALEHREELDVIWCRETTSVIQCFINGHYLEDHGEFCDTATAGSSLLHATARWKQLVEQTQASPEDRFEFCVVSRIVDVPTLGFAEEAYTGSRYYHMFPDFAGTFFRGVPASGLKSVPLEDRRRLGMIRHSETKVVSSRHTTDENDAAIERFLARVNETFRTETDPEVFCS